MELIVLVVDMEMVINASRREGCRWKTDRRGL